MQKRPSLSADWDVIRAAEHMIGIYGSNAYEIAMKRADQALQLDYEKRWRAIAKGIELLQGATARND